MKKKWISLLAVVLTGVWTLSASAGLPFFSREQLRLGLVAGGQQIYGDKGVTSSIGPGLDLLFLDRLSSNLGIALGFGYTELDSKNPANPNVFSELLTADLRAMFYPVQIGKLAPFISAGLGAYNFQVLNGPRYFDGSFFGGAGFEFLVKPRLGLLFNVDYRLTTGDILDNVVGDKNTKDKYLAFRAGITWKLTGPLVGSNETFTPGPIVDNQPVPEEQAAPETLVTESELQKLLVSSEGRQVSLADSVRLKLKELEQKVKQQEETVEKLHRVVEEKQEEVARLEEELANLGVGNLSPDQEAAFQQRYKEALRLHLNHQDEDAIRLFTALIRDFPNDRRVSNCYYWIGESYFALGDYDQAATYFEKVLNYSDSPKVDDALLMLGRTYMKKGDEAQARFYLEKLINEHPKSEYVSKARRYLQNLG
ncbi:MAG: tetratricopeptide repeat protein [Calditrichaeota bacterium]|nr:tetratricopeptide repeat protein [Calditrichota bacterium]